MKNLPYTKLPNVAISDLRLTGNTLRVLAYILSKPKDWEVYNKDVMKQLGLSNGTLAKAWKELIDAGYVRRAIKKDDEGGFIGGYFYEILPETL